MARSRGAAPAAVPTEQPVITDETVVSQPESTDTVTPEVAEPDQAGATEGSVTEPSDTEKTEPTEKPAEKPLDLEPFQTAVRAAVDQRDASTGTVPDGAFSEPNKAYRELPGAKGKGAAKRWLAEQMTALLNGAVDDPTKIYEAKAFMQVQNALVATGPKAEPKPKAPADPTEDFVGQYAALLLAIDLHASRLPEKVQADWETQVNKIREDEAAGLATYTAWADSTDEDKGDEPEVSLVVKRAYKLAAGKAAGKAHRTTSATPGTSTPRDPDAPRRSIEAHIRSAFADKPLGTQMKIAEIVNHRSDEYGTDAPSPGAVSARLQSNKPLPGFQLVMIDGKKGARSVAVEAA
jgi:hypothetical protein